jgi:DNA-binding MarR family transcriptional regulator
VETTVQKLGKTIESDIIIAEKYYAFLSVLNNLELAPREIQLLAFTAVKGNITYGNVRIEFCEKYKTTIATIGNMVCKLRKMKLLVKEKGMTKVNPQIVLNFSNNIVLQIKLNHVKEQL